MPNEENIKEKLPASHSTVKTTFDILMNILPDFFQLIYV